MFEKLKEYGLYIILGLIALGALAYAYVQTSNSQKGAEIQEANVNAMMTALSKSDKLKKSSTIAEDLLAVNGGRSIGKYKIDPDKVSYVIGETYNDVFDNKKMIDVSTDLSDLEEGQLRTILIAQPAATVNGEDVNTISLNSDKSLTIGENTITKENLNQVANELKGYNVGAIGYAAFDTEQEAKDFRDTYFSGYEIYEIGETGKFVVLTEYNTTGQENNLEGKVEATTNGEGLGEQNQEEQPGVEVCNEYLCLDANGVTMKAKPETTCGQEYEFQGQNYYVACNKNELRSKITNTYTRNRVQNPVTGEREREIDTPKEYNANQVITSKITDMSFLFDEEWEYREGESRYDCMEHYREGDGIRYFTDAAGVASWDVSNVTSMKSMFKSGSRFLSDDLSKWNVSNVTDMTGMFCGTGLTNMDLNNWNTSNVTNMSYMFAGSKFNGKIDKWNTSNVTNMQSMFSYCETFNQPIGSWNISNLESGGLRGFLRGHKVFNQDLSNWNLNNLSDGVDQIGNAFAGENQINYENYPILTYDITKRTELVNYEIGLLQDLINNGDGNAQLTSSQKTQYNSSLQSISNEIPGLLNIEHDIYVQRETNMQSLLTEINTLKTSIENDLIQNRYCHNKTQENNGSGVCENAIYLDSNGVTLKAKPFAKGSTWYEYNGKRYFIAENKSQIIGFIDGEGRFKTGKTFSSGIWTYRRQSDYTYDSVILTKVTDLSNMFGSKNYRKYGDISHWDVSNVTNFSRLFNGSESDFDGNLYYWDTSSATNMSYMFAGARCLSGSGYTGCSAFKEKGINNWDVSHVTNFEGMFQNTRFDIALDQWNTSSATNMRNMFKGSRMTHDIHNWNVSNVTNSTDFDASTSTNWTIDKKPQLQQFSIHDGTGIISLDSNGVTIKASSSAIGGYLYSFQGETYYVAKNSQDDVKSGILIYGADHVIVSKLTNMSSMFRYGYGLRNNGSGLTKVETLRNWDVSNVTNMNRTFEGYSRNYLDLQYWNVDNVTNCSNFNRNNAFTKPNFTRCTP